MTKSLNGDVIFNQAERVAPLNLLVLQGAKELGDKIDRHLMSWDEAAGLDPETFLTELECPRFSNGDGKGMIKSSIRGDDLFILVDVGNYSCSYRMFGRENNMSQIGRAHV